MAKKYVPTGNKPGNPNFKAKKGEPGYTERNVEAAHAAAAKACAIFPEAEELEHLCEEYFTQCDEEYKLYGEAGLALFLSDHNLAKRVVPVETLRTWCDGINCKHLQPVVQRAYMRIQAQIESDSRYQEKGMVTRSIFLQKQERFGGYQDRVETKNDSTFHFTFGKNMDESDFK